MNAVPASSTHPEAGVKLLNWVYASQANYDLFFYGTAGTDFTPVDPGQMTPISDPTGAAQLYSFPDWMAGNMTYERTSTTSPPNLTKFLYTTNTAAVNSPAATFNFDPTNVQSEYTDVETLVSQLIPPLACGVQDFDSNIQSVLSQLQNAGIDDLVSQYQQQLAAGKSQ